MLTEIDVYEILCETLPEQNDFYKTDYSEELQELFHFGITTRLQLLDMITKHKEKALFKRPTLDLINLVSEFMI